MDTTYKIITIIIFALLVLIGALLSIRVKRKGTKGVKQYSYWFTLCVSITIIFAFLFVYAWFW